MSTNTQPRRNTPQTVIAADRTPLQWASGREEYKQAGGRRFEGYVGWHIEQGKNPAFDAFATAQGVAEITIRHPRDNGVPVLAQHWHLGDAVRVFPITFGPLATTMRGAVTMSDRMARQAGIVAVWGDDGPSYLSFLALLEVGGAVFPEPLVITEKGTMTDHLYAALVVHLRMCEQADAVAGIEVPCAWIALPLLAGDEYPAGGGDKVTMVTKMDAVYAGVPDTINAAYLATISLPKDLRPMARDLCTQSLPWADAVLARQRRGGRGRRYA